MKDWWGLNQATSRLDPRLAKSSSYENTFPTMTEPSVSRLRVWDFFLFFLQAHKEKRSIPGRSPMEPIVAPCRAEV